MKQLNINAAGLKTTQDLGREITGVSCIRSHFFLLMDNPSEEQKAERTRRLELLAWHGERFCHVWGVNVSPRIIEDSIQETEYRFPGQRATAIDTDEACVTTYELNNVKINPRNKYDVLYAAWWQVLWHTGIETRLKINKKRVIMMYENNEYVAKLKKDKSGMYKSKFIRLLVDEAYKWT